MSASPDRDLAVTLLVDAARRGEQLHELPAAARPATLGDGYDIQDRFIDALGDEAVGWKLGAGSHKAKRDSGIGRSIAGRVLRGRLFDDGAAVPIHDAGPVTIEFEMAFVLARDIEPTDRLDDPMTTVGQARLVCELVRSRFVDRRAVGWPSFAADNAGFDALVVGPVIEVARLDEIMRTLVVDVDGSERVRAAQGDDVTSPTQAFADLVATAHERGMRLPKGSIISTGSMSVPFTILGSASIVATCVDARLAFTTVADRPSPPR